MLTIFELPFDPHLNRTWKNDRTGHRTKPGIFPKSIPARHLFGKRTSPSIRHAFGDNVIPPFKQPIDLFIGTCTAIQSPYDPFTLLWS